MQVRFLSFRPCPPACRLQHVANETYRLADSLSSRNCFVVHTYVSEWRLRCWRFGITSAKTVWTLKTSGCQMLVVNMTDAVSEVIVPMIDYFGTSFLQGWLRGLKRRSWKPLKRNLPRVRIPLLAPHHSPRIGVDIRTRCNSVQSAVETTTETCEAPCWPLPHSKKLATIRSGKMASRPYRRVTEQVPSRPSSFRELRDRWWISQRWITIIL